ncbi:hypothetical protein K501DRAFT_59412 [Backusella circina FSU 941]|nr:hypothetical protein K501DRAFT_59412 [Backusella circina FSU 941]
MSLGSLRSSNQYQQSMLGRNGSNSSQLMYTSSVGQPKIDLDNSMGKNMSSVNLSTDYQNVPFYSNTTSGFAPLPSPSSMTSSPNTPMLSPVRHSFSQTQQPRHYSMPITSSGGSSVQRYGYRNSFDMMSIQNDRPQIGTVHPHMIPEVNVYYNEARIKSENNHDHESINQKQQQQQSQEQSSFSSSPNIGQLLNPVHPLNKNPNPLQTSSDNTALFQSMGIPDNTTSAYPNYSSMNNNNRPSFDGKLPSIPDDNMLRSNTNTTGSGGGSGYGGYDSFYNQRQQPLANTHSVSDSIVPMFRNGIVHPSSMYDDVQTYGNDRPELGMEPLMLK